mgnify:FL=1
MVRCIQKLMLIGCTTVGKIKEDDYIGVPKCHCRDGKIHGIVSTTPYLSPSSGNGGKEEFSKSTTNSRGKQTKTTNKTKKKQRKKVEDQALRAYNYEKVILKVRKHDMCQICQSQSETIDHFTSGCPILGKHEYLKRHDKIRKYLY